MKVDQDKIDAFIAKLNARKQQCISCGNRGQTVTGDIYEVRVTQQTDYSSIETMCGGLGLGGYAYSPAVQVTCNNCGYIMLYNTVAAKLWGHKEPEPEPISALGRKPGWHGHSNHD